MFLNIHKKSDFLAGSQRGWLQRGNCMIDTKLALATFHIFRSVDVLQSLLYLYNMQISIEFIQKIYSINEGEWFLNVDVP